MIPPAAQPILDALVPAIRDALGDNFTGAYLCGSIALGNFEPETSDVDVLIVTERPISDAELEALRDVHRRIPSVRTATQPDYEAYYIDRATIRRFGPGQQQAKAEPHRELYREPHRSTWVLERWAVREHGIVLAGPDPKTLIDPVSPAEMRQAAADELGDRHANWNNGSWPRGDLAIRGTQSFEVETICRAMLAVAEGGMPSKRQAVEWGLATLPERWRELVEWSQTCRRDETRDESRMEEVLVFLEWAVGETL